MGSRRPPRGDVVRPAEGGAACGGRPPRGGLSPPAVGATLRPVHGRVEVDPNLEPVPIPVSVLNEICAHALQADPEECCGLVSGADGARFRRVHRCRNDMTALHERDPVGFPRDGRDAFHMNELDYEEVDRQAGERGERVTAIYHSHVGPGAYFSEDDQQFAADEAFPFPDADHIVVSVFEGRILGHGLFRRDPRTRRFEGRTLVPEIE